ncbi:Protein of unknown function [Gryllus bimaculatus]|nr:Protein of unknown function [Gryllus bimaculatus]
MADGQAKARGRGPAMPAAAMGSRVARRLLFLVLLWGLVILAVLHFRSSHVAIAGRQLSTQLGNFVGSRLLLQSIGHGAGAGPTLPAAALNGVAVAADDPDRSCMAISLNEHAANEVPMARSIQCLNILRATTACFLCNQKHRGEPRKLCIRLLSRLSDIRSFKSSDLRSPKDTLSLAGDILKSLDWSTKGQETVQISFASVYIKVLSKPSLMVAVSPLVQQPMEHAVKYVHLFKKEHTKNVSVDEVEHLSFPELVLKSLLLSSIDNFDLGERKMRTE